MSVHINEVEVEPRRAEQPQQPQQGSGGGGGAGGQEPPQPELANKIAAAVALLHARDRRLVAD
jgi:hypothetical protein